MKRLFAIALLFTGLAARAQETPTVTARVEPDSIMIGDRFDYIIDVEKDLVQVVEFPEFDPRDGKIELVDDIGTKLSTALPGKPVENVRKAVSIDVTRAVQEASRAKSARIGFRLDAAATAAAGSGWRWRPADFAAATGQQIAPTLLIVPA